MITEITDEDLFGNAESIDADEIERRLKLLLVNLYEADRVFIAKAHQFIRYWKHQVRRSGNPALRRLWQACAILACVPLHLIEFNEGPEGD